MRIIDLTHTFTQNMPVFPGDPPSTFTALEKEGMHDVQITTGMHVGTHIDAPLHMIPGGKQISDFPAEYFCSNGRLLDASGMKKIDVDILENIELDAGEIVLIMTGLSKNFGAGEYFENYPEMTEALAQKLIDAGIHMVGFDTPSPDRQPFLIHKLLLKNGVLIIENVANLEKLIGEDEFTICALPIKIDASGAPARVIAMVEG